MFPSTISLVSFLSEIVAKLEIENQKIIKVYVGGTAKILSK